MPPKVPNIKSLPIADGLEHFRSLGIENLWHEKADAKVIHLDFAQFEIAGTRDGLRASLASMLSAAGRSTDPGFNGNSFFDFFAWLQSQPGGSLVMLIDNYDSPLWRARSPENLADIRDILRNFHAFLKRYSGQWRLILIAGETKFREAGFESEINSLEDISLDRETDSLLGFTSSEIIENFDCLLPENPDAHANKPECLLQEKRKNCREYSFSLWPEKKSSVRKKS